MAKQLSPQEMRELAKELEEFELDPIELRYLGPLLKYMTRDKLANVKEIVINKPGQIGFEKLGGKWEFIDAPELTEEQLNDGARVLANRFGLVFSPNTPVLGCKMAQGHRVQIIAGRNSRSGFSLAIRIQRKEIFELSDFKLSAAHQQEIKDAVKNQKTILISGGTSSGKTSFMNVALRFIPEHERLVTLEDVPELEVPHTNHLALLFGSSGDEEVQARNITTILNATLRMRPDRILMGEIRKENAFTFCSAINTGHEGSMATIHANSPKSALDAILNRVMMNGDIPESSLNVLRRQLIDDIYGVVQLHRVGDHVEGYFERLESSSAAAA